MFVQPKQIYNFAWISVDLENLIEICHLTKYCIISVGYHFAENSVISVSLNIVCFRLVSQKFYDFRW